MEMHDAKIARSPESVNLVFELRGKSHLLCLTEDNPTKIKELFNELIKELKTGKFNFNLVDPGEDLYANVCIEYVKHLNSELSNVYGQMRANGLVT